MPNPNYTAICFVLDVSSSMHHDVKPMQKAFHKMLEDQARKLAGYLTVDVHYFNGGFTAGEEDADPMLIDLAMYANGGTNMYEGVKQGVARFESRIKALPADEQPGHVVVIVMSDGESGGDYQNGVREQNQKLVKNDGWDFAFVARQGVSLDRACQQLGIPRTNAISEEFSTEGIQMIADKTGQFISMSRSDNVDAKF